MGLFGPGKGEAWRRLGEEAGAEFIEGGFGKGSRVQAHVGPWTVTLDTYTVQTGHAHFTYTRMRAPYVNPEGLRFTVYRKGLFSELGKLLGMQDIETSRSRGSSSEPITPSGCVRSRAPGLPPAARPRPEPVECLIGG